MGAGSGIGQPPEQRLRGSSSSGRRAALVKCHGHDRGRPRARAVDQLENLYLEAFDLLGGDDGTEDLELKLRTLEVPKQEVSTEELVDALLYQLELLGMKVPPEMTGVDRVVMVAEAFLEEASAIVNRLNELGAEKVDALTELEQIEAELATIPPTTSSMPPRSRSSRPASMPNRRRPSAEARAAAEQKPPRPRPSAPG
jgi:hypothetical protein